MANDSPIDIPDMDDAAPVNLIPNSMVAQVDGGANANTTNQSAYLWYVRKLKRPALMADAGKNSHTSNYQGYLVVKCADGTFRAVLTYFTPSIKSTLICPNAIC
jgi:hypothetical protein